MGSIVAAYRRWRPPAGLRAALRQAGDDAERVLSWAPLADGATLAATNRGLWEVRPDGGADRLVWDAVDRAAWTSPRLTLDLSGGGRRDYLLDDPGSVPRDIRTRVEASVAWSRHHRLSTRAGVRVVARRPSTGGPLDWRLVWDDPAVAADPVLRAEAEALVEASRRSALG